MCNNNKNNNNNTNNIHNNIVQNLMHIECNNFNEIMFVEILFVEQDPKICIGKSETTKY